MKILIVTAAPENVTRGNRITANRWASILRSLGNTVGVHDSVGLTKHQIEETEILVAIHARRCAHAIENFRSHHAKRPVVVVLSGTDLHLDLKDKKWAPIVMRSLELADQIVVLEPRGKKQLPETLQSKTRVIYQSAKPVEGEFKRNSSVFNVIMLGHLRPVKDPFLVVKAAERLPRESKIQVSHYGVVLNEDMEQMVREHSEKSDRYHWNGVLSHSESQYRLAASQLVLLTSKFEGAPSVISEACVNGVPVLATRICATIGLLGDDYPGFFPVGNERRLAELLWAAETDSDFYNSLVTAVSKLQSKFTFENERTAWESLLNRFDK